MKRLFPAVKRGPHARRMPSERPCNIRTRYSQRETTRQFSPLQPEDPLQRTTLLAQLEACLFLADEPLTVRKLTELLQLPEGHHTRKLLAELEELLNKDQSPFRLCELAGGYILMTDQAYWPWLVRLIDNQLTPKLSSAALETLALIAYKQPIMRAEVDAIRGVASGDIIRNLLEGGVIKVVARHDSLGRPQLFGTTKKFLQMFGLNSVADLPVVPSMSESK